MDRVIENQIKSIPREIRKFLASSDWTKIADEIKQKNNLNPDQFAALKNEIIFVLIFLDLEANFKKNIKTQLNISEILVASITKEVEEKIFNKVRYFLPTEIENDELVRLDKKLLDQAEHMLETEVVQNQRDSQINNFGTINQTINPPTQTPVDKKLEELRAVNEEKDWQNRKEKIPDGQIIKRPYKEDPYREPPVA